MALDIRSILMTSMGIALILTVMMIFYRFTSKVYAGFSQWLLSDIFITVGFLLIALRGMVPDWLSVVFGNFFIVGAVVVLFDGINIFFDRTAFDRFNLIILSFITLLIVYFLYIKSNAAIRVVVVSFALAILLVRAGVLLLFNTSQGLRKTAFPGGLMMWATAVFFVIRGIDAVFNQSYNTYSVTWINIASYMMGGILVAAWTFGFFFLNSTRLELELKATQADLSRLASTDPLTGLYNRRYFFERANAEFSRARRYGHLFSVLILDLDLFKNINDRYGHSAGDLALQGLGKILHANVRTADDLARLGGEEFAILIINAEEENARITAERIREQVERSNIVYEDDKSISLTVSIGCATITPQDEKFGEILRRADKALYRAKDEGRNRVIA